MKYTFNCQILNDKNEKLFFYSLKLHLNSLHLKSLHFYNLIYVWNNTLIHLNAQV